MYNNTWYKKNPISYNPSLSFFEIKYPAVQFFGFQGKAGFTIAISNCTLSQKWINQMSCARQGELWWDILLSWSGFYRGDGSLLWGYDHRISRKLKQQTQKPDAGQVTPSGVTTRNSLFINALGPRVRGWTPRLVNQGKPGFRERSILTYIYLWTSQRSLSTVLQNQYHFWVVQAYFIFSPICPVYLAGHFNFLYSTSHDITVRAWKTKNRLISEVF